ncbi:LacI family DNA-binding transcriptional regulator [Arthrobacter sp. NPDC080073]|uniref:LacI family DNA-binding transcriptional regulator n=1 Tax=Arthrobacter sp. NPDC080073 TaxID=3155919 RepID=UPI003419E252
MAITMRDVAQAADVSIKTVSNVINDHPNIKAETRERVLLAIEKLGYQPNLSARGLRSGRTDVISLIIPDLKNAYFAELADAVMTAASKRGKVVIIEQSGGSRARELEILHGPRMRMVDGVLYSALGLSQEDAGLIDIPTPMVLLGERIFHGPTDHVTMQNIEASQAATEHLLQRGRTRLLAFGAHRNEVIGSAGLRLEGYRRALQNAGLDYRDELAIDVQSWHRADGAQAMRQVLESGLDFDGVVAFNDSIALGAMRVMQDAGLRIPEEVAIIGFDDIDETRYSLPTLSTVDPGRREIAETAVAMLLERIDGAAEAAPAREFAAGFKVISRESTAIRPAQDSA